MSRRQLILDTASDAAVRFLYYDRKEDAALPVGAIEEAIKVGEVSVDEVVEVFREAVAKAAGR